MTASLQEPLSPECQRSADEAKVEASPSSTSYSSSSFSSSSSKKKKKHRTSFRSKRYDNVEHTWENKPFVKDRVRFLFGGMSEAKMDRVVSQKKQQIEAVPGLADPEGLALNDMCSPFKSKLLFSIESSSDKKNLPADLKVEYLSGTWLSKVYRGSYNHFLEWVDDAAAYVLEHYGKQVDPHHDWYTYYPSALDKQKSNHEAVLVFFIKISD